MNDINCCQTLSEIFLSLQLIKVFVEKDIGQQFISFILDNPVVSIQLKNSGQVQVRASLSKPDLTCFQPG